NPVYFFSLTITGEDNLLISEMETSSTFISGNASIYLFVIDLLISTYLYKLDILLPIGNQIFSFSMILCSIIFSLSLRTLKSLGLLIVTSILKLFPLSYILI